MKNKIKKARDTKHLYNPPYINRSGIKVEAKSRKKPYYHVFGAGTGKR